MVTGYLETEYSFPDLGSLTRWLRVPGSVNGVVKQRNRAEGGIDRSREALPGRSCVLFLGRPGFLADPCVPQDGRGVYHTCVLHRGISPSAKTAGQGPGPGPP